jgi:hypothetical protein
MSRRQIANERLTPARHRRFHEDLMAREEDLKAAFRMMGDGHHIA